MTPMFNLFKAFSPNRLRDQMRTNSENHVPGTFWRLPYELQNTWVFSTSVGL